MKKNIIKSTRNKLLSNSNNFKYFQCLCCFIGVLISISLKAQTGNKLLISAVKRNQLVTINRADYMLRCPINWRVDSAESLLTITPKLTWKDSITVSVHSFKTEVLEFKSFMKNPDVDFDAKTTITASNDVLLYKVTSTKHCDTCANQNKKREQYYSVSKNKVYVLYFTASNKLLQKYKEDLDLIFTSFELKY